MNTLCFRLFGKISIQQNEQPRTELPAKALELLCYLLLYRDRIHSRETLAEVLWPDTLSSKKYLRQTLWQLQASLDSQTDEKPTQPLLIHDPGCVRINCEATWWLDVAAFEQAYTLYRDVPGQDLTDQQAHTLEAAIALYNGDLLATWYQDWCIYERERLQLLYLAMLEKLMLYCEARKFYTKGTMYGQLILRYDPARETTHRQLMRLYYKAGDRTNALHQYERCVSALAKEFDLPPTQETAMLYTQLRADRLEDAPPIPLDHQQPIPQLEIDLLLDLHKRLDQIQANLLNLQNQLQQELTSIRHLLQHERKTRQQTHQQTWLSTVEHRMIENEINQ